MAISKLVSKVIEANPNNYTQGRNGYKICKFTPHHMAGILTAEQCGKIFQAPNRRASANYGIGNDGAIACYVDEDNRSWASSSRSNDCQAITVEVSNCERGGEWKISEAAWNSLVILAVDVCQRYNFRLEYDGTPKGSLTRHNMFTATTCPGPYLQSRFLELAETVNRILDGKEDSKPYPTIEPLKQRIGDVVTINGVYTASNSVNKLLPQRKQGTITRIITGAINPYLLDNGNLGWVNDACIIDSTASAKKSTEDVAKEILYNSNFGGWGTGTERKQKLANAGYNPDEVQRIINAFAAGTNPIKQSIEVDNIVKIKSNAKKYATGENIPNWVKKNSYQIIQKMDQKVLLDSILSWVYIEDIYKV